MLASCGSRPSAGPPPPPNAAVSGHAIETVFLIVMENHNWSEILGNPDAPYINHTLLPLGAHASHYFNPPGVHPSLPNYLWLEAGTNFGIFDDNPPGAHPLRTTRHLVTLLSRAHVSWRVYADGISGSTCPLSNSYPYAVRHNPTMYFGDDTSGWNPTSAGCIQHNRPMAQLTAELRSNRVARYNLIIPGLCNDMHDFCLPVGPVAQGDDWLRSIVPSIFASKAFGRGLVLVTWDEGEGGDGPIGMIALSPYARRGYTGGAHYTHSSTLRTLEEIFGVRPFLGGAAHALDLRALFTRFP